jgi:hypothetical protein
MNTTLMEENFIVWMQVESRWMIAHLDYFNKSNNLDRSPNFSNISRLYHNMSYNLYYTNFRIE